MRSGYVVYQAATEVNTRTISKHDWLLVGVEDQDQLHWGPENNWKVPAADISDAAWPHIERDDGLLYEPDEEAKNDDGAPVQKPEVRGADKAKRQPRSR